MILTLKEYRKTLLKTHNVWPAGSHSRTAGCLGLECNLEHRLSGFGRERTPKHGMYHSVIQKKSSFQYLDEIETNRILSSCQSKAIKYKYSEQPNPSSCSMWKHMRGCLRSLSNSPWTRPISFPRATFTHL